MNCTWECQPPSAACVPLIQNILVGKSRFGAPNMQTLIKRGYRGHLCQEDVAYPTNVCIQFSAPQEHGWNVAAVTQGFARLIEVATHIEK